MFSSPYKLRTTIEEVAIGGPGIDHQLPIQLTDNQRFIQAGLGDTAAIRRGDAALAAVMDLAFTAAVVGIGHVTLVFEGAGADGDVGDEVVGNHVRRRHQDQLRAGQRQAPGVFRELEVVADQEAELPAIEFHHRKIVLAGAEHRPVEIAEQMSLAVVAQALAMGVDQLHGVVDLRRLRCARGSRTKSRCPRSWRCARSAAPTHRCAPRPAR